jgi:glycosyltransferase involved in cell wall biosynthesis
MGTNDFSSHLQRDQKRQEIEIADLTVVPSRFVERTIRELYPDKTIARARYGVDAEFWTPRGSAKPSGPLQFVYAGRISVPKGIPLLLEAWSKAALSDARLELVGSWMLAEGKRRSLPAGVTWCPSLPPAALRSKFQNADVFVFPSFAEGLALVLLEAMACGLPVMASEASGAADVVAKNCGVVFPTGNMHKLVEYLRWFGERRDELASMSKAATLQARYCAWEDYRSSLTRAISELGILPSSHTISCDPREPREASSKR